MKATKWIFPVQRMVAILVAIVLTVSMVLPVLATDVIVNTTVDKDDGTLGDLTNVSLREAIKHSSDGDVIKFNIPLPNTITLTLGQLTIAKNLTINGPGADVLTISGSGLSRIFNINSAGIDVVITDLKIEDGFTSGTLLNNTAGGILVTNCDSITISRVVINNCVAGLITNNEHSRGGGLYVQIGDLTLTDCVISNNESASLRGLSFIKHAFGGGIAIGASASALIERCAIIDNDCLTTGTSNSRGGGIYSEGDIQIINTTISGNYINRGGSAAGCHFESSSYSLNFCTVSNNVADHPTQLGYGGIYQSSSTGNIQNTIIAGNSGTALNDVQNTTFHTMGYTIIGNNPGITITNDLGGNVFGINPLLPLANNGGATFTHALNPNISGAIDAIAPGNCSVATDQRGISRPQGSACDIGAFELESTNQAPVALCQDVTVSAVLNCEADASIDNGSYDPDDDPITITQDPPGPYPVGTTAVTLTVDDGLATGQCTANVTVMDDTPPVPDIATLPDAVGECSVTLTPPTATDNCAGTIIATTGDPLTYAEAGSFMVTWTYDDGNGNSVLQNQNVIVNGGAGTISGTVTVNGNALAGVKVALLDTMGIQIAGFDTLITDSYGNYLFSDVPPDTYLVRLIEPLGYTAGENPMIDTLGCGEADMVDFVLEQTVVGNNSVPAVWWDLQFFLNIFNLCNPEESEQDLLSYIDLVQQHYTPHFTIFQDDVTLVDWWEKLRVWNNLTPYKRARRQLAALLMNMVSGRVGQYSIVTADSRTAGEVLTYVSQLLTNPGSGTSEYLTAELLAGQVNLRRTIAAGKVPHSSILYKNGEGLAFIDWGFGQNLPEVYSLDQNYPNPFNPSTSISFALPEPGQVSLNIYNVQGQLVRTLASGNHEAGTYNLQWDATNNFGVKVSSGIYFYRLQAGSYVEIRKMTLLR